MTDFTAEIADIYKNAPLHEEAESFYVPAQTIEVPTAEELEALLLQVVDHNYGESPDEVTYALQTTKHEKEHALVSTFVGAIVLGFAVTLSYTEEKPAYTPFTIVDMAPLGDNTLLRAVCALYPQNPSPTDKAIAYNLGGHTVESVGRKAEELQERGIDTVPIPLSYVPTASIIDFEDMPAW